jgi:hypothetical protein
VSDQAILVCVLLVVLANLAVGGGHLYLKLRDNRVTLSYLRRADETLAVVKVWCELAHTQHRDAKRVMEKVESRSDSTSVDTVIKAVDQVPDKVVEKIKEAGGVDSGQFLPRPPLPPPDPRAGYDL